VIAAMLDNQYAKYKNLPIFEQLAQEQNSVIVEQNSVLQIQEPNEFKTKSTTAQR
jgi:hypothetical protein